jgi:predicted Ser/Thr protein kinase
VSLPVLSTVPQKVKAKTSRFEEGAFHGYREQHIHTRLYNTLMRDGTSNLLDSDDPHVNRLYKDEYLKVYNFFKDEFFGIERTIVQIARYLHRLFTDY